jgi:hypothetical protein
MAANEGKERSFLKGKMVEAKIPQQIIDELLPAEVPGAAAAGGPAGGTGAASPATAAKPEAKK